MKADVERTESHYIHRWKTMAARQGMALLFAIFVMAVTSALVVAMTNTQMIRYSALRNTRDWEEARYLAEAGLHHAFSELEADFAWSQGIANQEFPIGSGRFYSVEVQDDANGDRLVRSIGISGSFRRTLDATIKQGG